ncbi:type IV conjugative transfer system lipoprotein TraV, partial [Escherichia coli]|uniref:type IV conjugative transfer system lipoprotein TraV n=1 Tax=Escherichia coli TaxID=562 RepID=UPI00390BE3A7
MFSHSVYLFLREFSLQDSRGGSIPLLGTLLLSGCAGTSTEFECNATTSDTCMTMEQANEKAKKLEQSSEAKPVAASLPRL